MTELIPKLFTSTHPIWNVFHTHFFKDYDLSCFNCTSCRHIPVHAMKKNTASGWSQPCSTVVGHVWRSANRLELCNYELCVTECFMQTQPPAQFSHTGPGDMETEGYGGYGDRGNPITADILPPQLPVQKDFQKVQRAIVPSWPKHRNWNFLIMFLFKWYMYLWKNHCSCPTHSFLHFSFSTFIFLLFYFVSHVYIRKHCLDQYITRVCNFLITLFPFCLSPFYHISFLSSLTAKTNCICFCHGPTWTVAFCSYFCCFGHFSFLLSCVSHYPASDELPLWRVPVFPICWLSLVFSLFTCLILLCLVSCLMSTSCWDCLGKYYLLIRL